MATKTTLLKHTVGSNEKISDITSLYNITRDDLKKYNADKWDNIVDAEMFANHIDPGTILNIPISKTESTKTSTGTEVKKPTEPAPLPSSPPLANEQLNSVRDTIKDSIAAYTAQIWVNNAEGVAPLTHKFEPHFYSDQLDKIRANGFDISIVYGGSIQSIIELNKYKASKDANSFNQFSNNSIRAIRRVFIRSVGQEFDASGNPIYEIYEFVGADLE